MHRLPRHEILRTSTSNYQHPMLICLQSTDCQKAHWREHKAPCKNIQSENKALADADAKMSRVTPATSGLPLLPGQVAEELRAFVSHFTPHILAASVNTFRTNPSDAVIRGWEDDILLLRLSRRETFPANAPKWARFTVDHWRRLAMDDMDDIMSGSLEYAQFRAMRPGYVAEAKRRGPGNGVMFVWVVCWSDVGTIQGPQPQFFSPAVARSDALPNELDAEAYLKTYINKLSTGVTK